MTHRVLIGCPIRQRPAILTEFLRSLSELRTPGLSVEYRFVDDNTDETSSAMLRRFQEQLPAVSIRRHRDEQPYICDATAHHWNRGLECKVAGFKDEILQEASRREADHVFLVDSDLVLHPDLLPHLVSLNKPVVSEVFWTSWTPDSMLLPQVWLSDRYTLFEGMREEKLTPQDVQTRVRAFLNRLRRPGVYRVGGLGACTLISRAAIERGLSFSEIDNLSFAGEDRHFCIRARALGVDLWADTQYPPLHLYRDVDLYRVAGFRARVAADYLAHPRITLSMAVRNEADRWLGEALRLHRTFINDAVIIDDGSTDGTVELVRKQLDGIPLRMVCNESSRFSNEILLRKQQWDATLATNPDWLIFLDADDILEHRAATVIPELARQTDYSVFGFHLHDFWSETHYRDDELWCAHKCPRPFMIRYSPDFRYVWKETPQHCGRMPANVLEQNSAIVDLRIRHMGWSTRAERERKYSRYKELDPNGQFGVQAQYDSILDPSPNLVAWQDQPTAS